MSISTRIRKIREFSGLKQGDLAKALHTTQQAYSDLEIGADHARIETLRGVCNVLKIQLSFLIAEDIPVSEKNIKEYGRKKFWETISKYEQAEIRLRVYDELLHKAEG